MVALNYQTPDRAMQLNEGRFLQNGRCGYVLRPEYMFHDEFDPYTRVALDGVEPLTLSLSVIAARHLKKRSRGIASPYVEVEVTGSEYDSFKDKTHTIREYILYANMNDI